MCDLKLSPLMADQNLKISYCYSVLQRVYQTEDIYLERLFADGSTMENCLQDVLCILFAVEKSLAFIMLYILLELVFTL